MTNIPLWRLAWTLIAWTLVAGIVFATLGPQSLRPHLGNAQIERFGAYFVTAVALVLAYPRRPWTIALSAVTVAVLLELGQLIVPGRDAGIPDAIAKALGGVSGAAVATALSRAAGFSRLKKA
jgi:VanZ family protein